MLNFPSSFGAIIGVINEAQFLTTEMAVPISVVVNSIKGIIIISHR